MAKKIKPHKKHCISNILKLVSIGILIILILFNHYYYSSLSSLLHITITTLLISLIITIIFLTKQGKKILFLINETKKETKKIHWPHLKETFHTTIIVIIVTIVISLILWGLDNILIRVVSFFTSLRI
ncbi:MAG: preprotein translocase subunit SecE [Buchnera aphidicola (Nurudea shiraii)]